MREPSHAPTIHKRSNRALRSFALAAGLVLGTSTHSAVAEDLGRYGNLWEIEEPDGVEQMLDKLRQMERDGSLEGWQEKYRQDFIHRMENPVPVAGISTATEPRTYMVDPSIVLQEPIVNEDGTVIAAPGTRINPFDFTSWSKAVVLIDARDPAQVDFVTQRLEQHPNDKIILVGGSFLKLMRELRVRVYYDLNGAFTTRFGLQRVPAVVSQQGKSLLVQEFALQDAAQ